MDVPNKIYNEYTICYVVSTFYPTPEATTPHEISSHVASRGHDVFVVVLRLKGWSVFLSPERDVDSLVDNICHLFDNSETWGLVGKSGREHVEKYHDVRKEVKFLEKIYEDTLLE